MSPAQIAEWDKRFRAWAVFAPGPQRGRCVNTVRCPIPPRRGRVGAYRFVEVQTFRGATTPVEVMRSSPSL